MLKTVITSSEAIVIPIFQKLGTNSEKVLADIAVELQKIPKVSGAGVTQTYMSPQLSAILAEAEKEANAMQDEYVSAEHVLIAMSSSANPVGGILKRNGVNRDDILKVLKDIRGTQRVTDPNPEDKYQALERFTRDLTRLARRGKLDPVIGRDDEIRRVIQVLSRRTKNNPILIGEPGVGKTAIAEGLAQRIASGDVPDALRDKRVLSLGYRGACGGFKVSWRVRGSDKGGAQGDNGIGRQHSAVH